MVRRGLAAGDSVTAESLAATLDGVSTESTLTDRRRAAGIFDGVSTVSIFTDRRRPRAFDGESVEIIFF